MISRLSINIMCLIRHRHPGRNNFFLNHQMKRIKSEKDEDIAIAIAESKKHEEESKKRDEESKRRDEESKKRDKESEKRNKEALDLVKKIEDDMTKKMEKEKDHLDTANLTCPINSNTSLLSISQDAFYLDPESISNINRLISFFQVSNCGQPEANMTILWNILFMNLLNDIQRARNIDQSGNVWMPLTFQYK